MFDLQPIKDRLAAATPGPWYQDEDNWWGIRDKDEEIVAEAILVHKTREANAELIANAPQDLTALVAEIERLQGAIKKHRDLYKRENLEPEEYAWAALDEADRKLWETLDD